MERDFDLVVSVGHDSSLPCAGKILKNASRRASLFQRFLSFFCCYATPVSSSMSRCNIRIVGSESTSSPSNGSSPTSQVGLIRVISFSDELYLSSLGYDYIQGEDSTPQSYVLVDESSFAETILEQDRRSEDLGAQSYVLAEESSFGDTISEQDGRSISSHASEGSDSIRSEDSTSQGYETTEELTLGETTSEQDRRSISSHASKGFDSIQGEDSTTQGYESASEELTLDETISEQDRKSLPSPYEGYDSIPWEYLISQLTEIELIQDSSPNRYSHPPSIESAFPPQNSAPGTIRRAKIPPNIVSIDT